MTSESGYPDGETPKTEKIVMTDTVWPENRRAAVSLSYDDARQSHLDVVAPQLEAAQLRGTFYVPVDSPLIDDPSPWAQLAESGHELGNHTIFHPCRKRDGRDWPDDAFDLRAYSQTRWRREVSVANRVLAMIDGKSRRTFGNTCHNTTIGPADRETPLDPMMADYFVAARGSCLHRPVDPRQANLANLGCYSGDRKPLEALQSDIAEGLETGGWIIFCIHDVPESAPGETDLALNSRTHSQLLDGLSARRDAIWTAPVVDIARWIGTRTTGG